MLTLVMPLTAALSGCGAGSEDAKESSSPIMIPEVISAEGVDWTRADEMLDADEERLSDFFAKNPSLTENPRISSQPLVYRGPGGKSRFYWVDDSRSPVEWSLIELGSGKAHYEEGQGGPF